MLVNQLGVGLEQAAFEFEFSEVDFVPVMEHILVQIDAVADVVRDQVVELVGIVNVGLVVG